MLAGHVPFFCCDFYAFAHRQSRARFGNAGKARLELVKRVTQANARRLRLQRYFSPGVGELLEQHDDDHLAEGRECELTVVFTDIRGFTRLSEELDSREVISFLNLKRSCWYTWTEMTTELRFVEDAWR